MNGYQCHEVKDRRTRAQFLSLPGKLYGNDCPQDLKAEKQLLAGTHILSPDFEVIPFITTDRSGQTLCRCVLTYYPGDERAYLGFFESVEEIEPVKTMFRHVEQRALADGKTSILGPVDASIYINYRFKADRFDKTYTGEPYNKPYYPSLWEACGYTVCGHYHSNQLRRVEDADIDPRLVRIYDRFQERGYRFVTGRKEDFDRHLGEIGPVMMELYSGFTGFKPLTQQQFLSLFSYLKFVLNFEMVKLVYKDDKLRAFGVCLPNYGALTRGRMTPWKFLQLLKIRRKPEEYVILYVGAEPGSSGLGGALVHEIRNSLRRNGCTSIGALIKEGNITGRVYDMLYTDKFRYVLFSKPLK